LKISTSEEFLEPVHLGTGSVCSLMSALGQNQTLKHVRPMSALHPKADMDGYSPNVRFVPIAVIVLNSNC
jgi:hypothetical protein